VAKIAGGLPGLIGDLRSDHAGETSAVAIYLGILAVSRDPKIRAFAQEHLATEREHIARMEALLRPGQRSVLLPLWRVAGWLTGFLPALAGPRAVYATIDAVETFVDHH
jgi:ubiquinone biosynthesis monooxygenase Coq7